MDDLTKNLYDVVISLAQLVTILGATIWGYFRFRKERSHAPHVEFGVDCTFHGPEQGKYIAEFRIRARNHGLVIHRFNSIRLRVRGIEAGQPLRYWEGHEPRTEFPDLLLDDVEVLYKPKYDQIFVEPGVEQLITYTTIVPSRMRFIVARAAFSYDIAVEWPHSAERVFSIDQHIASSTS